MRWAASHYFGENPEDNAGKPLDEFVRKIELNKIKPDLRLFGFNNPSPNGNEAYGYEFWVTIPEELDVPAPLKRSILMVVCMLHIASKWVIFMNDSFLANGLKTVPNMNMRHVSHSVWEVAWKNTLMHIYSLLVTRKQQSSFNLICLHR